MRNKINKNNQELMVEFLNNPNRNQNGNQNQKNGGLEMQEKIQKVRELLKRLGSEKEEDVFEQARRFLWIHESLAQMNRIRVR